METFIQCSLPSPPPPGNRVLLRLEAEDDAAFLWVKYEANVIDVACANVWTVRVGRSNSNPCTCAPVPPHTLTAQSGICAAPHPDLRVRVLAICAQHALDHATPPQPTLKGLVDSMLNAVSIPTVVMHWPRGGAQSWEQKYRLMYLGNRPPLEPVMLE